MPHTGTEMSELDEDRPDEDRPDETGRGEPSTEERVVPGKKVAGGVALVLGAIGVVFGDIGTSPLYAIQTVFSADDRRVAAAPVEVYGVISLVFWAITIIVSVKYVSFIMRADNDGEGGIMALTALLQKVTLRTRGAQVALVALGVFGASLFYGDGIITPAISVLSAVEGVKVAAPSLSDFVLPITVVVLTGLFTIQRFGSGAVGKLFGPTMVLWFSVLGVVGVHEMSRDPAILRSLSPTYGVAFMIEHGTIAFIALGYVVLAVTGAEALYADMGHFGASPIRRAWFFLVFPALTLNYMAQGALILRSPESVSNPFFLMLPSWSQIPMVVLATFATVIASQSVISGAFSVTRQAVQLGYLPRMTIRHTSQKEVGQVYSPAINWTLYVAVLGLVLGFRSSASLASAYGVAVTATFALNTVLFLVVARSLWRRPRWLVAVLAIVFLTTELTFFAANLTKVAHGGWLPLSVAAAVFAVLMTWQRGRTLVTRKRIEEEGDLAPFLEEVAAARPPVGRVSGTAVFLASDLSHTPLALRANVEHNHVLHDNVVILQVLTTNVPYVDEADRIEIHPIKFGGGGLMAMTATFGFQDIPDVPRVMALAQTLDLPGSCVIGPDPTYFLSRITIVQTKEHTMPRWQKRLFTTIAHNAANPAEYFGIPIDRCINMTEQVGI